MRFTHLFSITLLVAGLFGTASACANDPFSLGSGPYPPVGEEVWRFVASSAASSTPRTQVVAEMREAQRLLAIVGGLPVAATQEQQSLIKLAGQSAVRDSMAMR